MVTNCETRFQLRTLDWPRHDGVGGAALHVVVHRAALAQGVGKSGRAGFRELTAGYWHITTCAGSIAW